MLGLAARFGDPDPTSIAAAAAHWSEAIHAATAGSIPTGNADAPMYFVVMTGHFNPFTAGGGSDLGLGDGPPSVPLETFGPVSDLTGPF